MTIIDTTERWVVWRSGNREIEGMRDMDVEPGQETWPVVFWEDRGWSAYQGHAETDLHPTLKGCLRQLAVEILKT